MSKRKAFVHFVTAENVLFLAAATMLAFAARVRFFPFESGDYHQFLQGWFSVLKEGGGLAALGQNIGDYMPPYFYLLALLTYLPVRDLYLIKLLSFVSDIVMACFAMRLVRLKYKEFWGEITYAVVLLLPSVVLNSAAWGQCDSIYTAALLACVYYLTANRPNAAVTAFSIAFVFKLQAVFLAPFLLLMLLRHKIRWRSLLIVPAVYILAILPAAAMGRNFGDLLTVYFRQARQYSDISMYLPNLSVWYPKDTPVAAGTAIAVLAVLASLAVVLLFHRLEFDLTDEMIVSLALLSVLFVPYVLPYMHERYFYPADILAVIYAFYFPEKFYIPILTVLSSTYVVCHNLFHAHFINIKVLSVLMLCCLLWVSVSTVYLARDEKIEKVVRRRWLS
ncbi:MAG: glycosyltransferase 87 family protein [Oscillospiraceae bacterium]|jgi:Gpi18-like mannosyltransferase|nr:glycosyltransferase 87 family protein [Oscillospiraceae bacterium]MCI1989728.1 glycosyltransferase 87 family protein [Oscillospiraceae bacterium]MCI2034331.1 glycosyltransferase 87 family protein [Oscillospiraceae bacterium]